MSRREKSAGGPSQFYTGLVAELYEPLLSERSRAEDYLAFLDGAGTPALELACGSGLPLVDLVARGYEVEGLDASRDMLDRCLALAKSRGVDVTVYEAEMQSFSLPRRYRSIFLAGASFILLTNDDDARAALGRIHGHLEPGGSALIPLEIPELRYIERQVGHFREAESDAGERLRVGLVSFEVDHDDQCLTRRLRYERISASGESEVVERDWITRWWTEPQFEGMLRDAGFDAVRFVDPSGGTSVAGASVFVALARNAASNTSGGASC